MLEDGKVRFNESCIAELMNDYGCEAQNYGRKVQFLFVNKAKTITNQLLYACM